MGRRSDPWPWLFLLTALVIGAVVALWWWQEERDEGPRTVVVEVTRTVTEATTTEREEGIPDVVGRDHVEAGEAVEAAGYRADTYPVDAAEARGTVVAQRQSDRTVRLNVSLGKGPRESLEVPDVTGPGESDARDAARRAGFTVRTVDRDAPTAEELGEVLTQEPAAGSVVPELTQITIFVGR